MYLLLILLISPAFGRPSSDLLDVREEITRLEELDFDAFIEALIVPFDQVWILNPFESFVSFNNETGNILGGSQLIKDVIKSLLEAERNILEMQAELKLLETEEMKFEDNYFPKYNEAKRYLRETRQELRELAYRTVTEVRDLKVLLEDLDKTNDHFFLKNAIDQMKDLMIETLETLKEAREKYNTAVQTFEDLNSSIKTQNIQLKKMLIKDSAEYKVWVSKAKTLQKRAVGRAIGLIFLDIFGCFGICTLINAAVSAPALKAEEEKIAEYGEEINKLKNITDRMLESGNNFDNTIKTAIDFLTDEIDLISVWTKSAKVVRKNIDKYPEEYLRKYKSVRTIFISGLDDLKKAAEDFLAQPKDILKID